MVTLQSVKKLNTSLGLKQTGYTSKIETMFLQKTRLYAANGISIEKTSGKIPPNFKCFIPLNAVCD